jgi:hypothetical protein
LTTTCDTDIGSFGDKALSSGKTNAASAASDKSSEASFRKAVKVNPSELETYINLGIVLYDCGKLEEASAQSNKPFISTPVAPMFRGGFARQEVDSDPIQQLRQQIET